MNEGILVDQAFAIQDGRARLKLSQEHLASAAGISARTVVRAESGFRVSGESLRNMCAVLGLDSGAIAPVKDDPGAAAAADEAPATPDGTEADAEPGGGPLGMAEATASMSVIRTRWDRLLALGRTPIKQLPWHRLLAMHRAQVFSVLAIPMAISCLWCWTPIINKVTIPSDTGRWMMEATASRATAAYLNAIAAGRQAARPPALSYFACGEVENPNSPFRMLLATEDGCGFTRHEILIETVRPPDGTVQTIVGPVGREFGRDLARRLSGDPAVGWKVAYATGRQARGLAWFDPREVPTQDLPRPPDARSTWVYVTMSKAGR